MKSVHLSGPTTGLPERNFSTFLAEIRGMGSGVSAAMPALVADRTAVYLSPSGRRCRVFEVHFSGRRALVLYDLKDGSPCVSYYGDGFTLSRANWHLLRRVE